MKRNIAITLTFILALAIFFSVATNQKTQIILESDSLLLDFNIDSLIRESEMIVIGEVIDTFPSLWNGPQGLTDPEKASPDDISRAHGLFSDSQISINQILKGYDVPPVLRVRSYTGETEKVRWVNASEPSYVTNSTYLLFLVKDIGVTAKVNPGNYVSVGAYQGVYEIVDGRAISKTDEWDLGELTAYIEKSVSETK